MNLLASSGDIYYADGGAEILQLYFIQQTHTHSTWLMKENFFKNKYRTKLETMLHFWHLNKLQSYLFSGDNRKIHIYSICCAL